MVRRSPPDQELPAGPGGAFEEINIDSDEEAARLVMKHNEGKRSVSTLEIEGAFYGNPALQEIEELIGSS